MKAVRLLEYGGQSVFNDVATPTMARDEILVKIKSTAVNHLDLVVRFYRLQPDDVRVELVAAWKKANPSVVLRAFLELIDTNAAHIRIKAELH
jgi:NADPH:quinone reductase-like Zn-dependent oxidoreductase